MPETKYVDSNLVASTTTNGEKTMPLQPAFLAYLASNDNNRTGDGTSYTLGTNTAFTEVYDQNGDFNTNGTFTAPVTGKYLLIFQVMLDQSAGGTTLDTSIVTSNRTYRNSGDPSVNPSSFCHGKIMTIADMDASDTATFTVSLTGIGAATADILGSGTLFTYVSGALLC